MRVASNSIKHMSDFYFSELKDVYTESEIQALFEHAINHYLGWSISEIAMKQNELLNQSELLKIYDCAKALKKQIPLQYILGETFFYGLALKVDPHVLIPRPETEELVDLVVKENKNAASFLDIGTGSGCIPVALKKQFPKALVSACDISPKALAVANKNATLNKTDVLFFEADILNTGAFTHKTAETFDVIISNPPYIKASEKSSMADNVVKHEPHLALFVNHGDDIIFYKKIIDICSARLNHGGRLYFELNPLTAESVRGYAGTSLLFKTIELLKDMSGNTRFLKATRT